MIWKLINNRFVLMHLSPNEWIWLHVIYIYFNPFVQWEQKRCMHYATISLVYAD